MKTLLVRATFASLFALFACGEDEPVEPTTSSGASGPGGGSGASTGSTNSTGSAGGGGASASSVGGAGGAGGAGEGGGSGGAESCGPEAPFFGTGACVACVEARCCPQKEACASDPECAAIRACVGACESSSCASACQDERPEGYPENAVLLACASKECGAECSLDPAYACGVAHPDPTCNACAVEQCCAELYAASQSADYHAWQLCRANECAPEDAACAKGCNEKHPEAIAKVEALSGCAGAKCADACP